MPPKTRVMENTEDVRILFSRVVICVQHSEAFGRAYLQIWRTIDTPPRTVNDRRRTARRERNRRSHQRARRSESGRPSETRPRGRNSRQPLHSTTYQSSSRRCDFAVALNMKGEPDIFRLDPKDGDIEQAFAFK